MEEKLAPCGLETHRLPYHLCRKTFSGAASCAVLGWMPDTPVAGKAEHAGGLRKVLVRGLAEEVKSSLLARLPSGLCGCGGLGRRDTDSRIAAALCGGTASATP